MVKSINILGPFSSGTNLITNIITDATNINLVKLINKHEFDFVRLEKCIQEHPNVLFIVMYRPLFSWVESMKLNSYDIRWDKNNIKSNASIFGNNYNSITEIYNTYYLNYMKLINKYPNVISMRYYSLVHPKLSYGYILSKLSPFFCMDKQSALKFCFKLNFILSKPSKSHGHSVNNNNEAIKNFVNLQNESKHKYNKYENNTITTFFENY